MLSAVAQSLAGALDASVEVLVAAATPRVLLRVQAVEASARQLVLADLEVAGASVGVLVAEEAAAVALAEVTAAAFEEGSAAVAVEAVDMAVAVVASATKAQTATLRPMVLPPVLEDHEVGLAAVATAAIEEATAMAAAVVTGEEEAIEAPAVPTTSRSAGIATTTATATVEVETATAAVTTRGNVRMRATAMMTEASAEGTKPRRLVALRWVCQGYLPFLHSTFFVNEGKTRTYMNRISSGG